MCVHFEEVTKMRGKERNKKSVFLGIGVCFAVCAIGIGVSTVYARSSSEKLVIPSKTAVLENGYPVNERGLAYGPHIENMKEPDLILVEEQNGMMGYVKQTDLAGQIPENPEEACMLNQQKSYSIPTYLQDGETVIGSFLIETSEVVEE